MAFVKFIKTGSRIGSPRVSIWTRGQIGFNKGASLTYKIDSYEYAVLYYDEDTNRMGIQLTDDEKAEGISKLVHRKDGGLSFSAISFLRTFGIDFKITRQYDIEYDDGNDMYIIDLNNPI